VVPLLLSWGGFLYDAAIVPLLCWRRSRVLAWVAVVVFHGLTRAFFQIGMFPFIMIAATTVFFAPDWPRALARRVSASIARRRGPTRRRGPVGPLDDVTDSTLVDGLPADGSPADAGRRPVDGGTDTARRNRWLIAAVVVGWCAVQGALPLRTFALTDDVLWDETGMRWSWRVMVREKSGSLAYRVEFTDDVVGRRTVWVSPHDWLTWRQVNEMIGQPDLILQLAHAIRDDVLARGHRDVRVFADARVTLNGRPPAPFLDPAVDLAAEQDCLLCRPRFVLPRPSTAPPSPWRSTGPATTTTTTRHVP